MTQHSSTADKNEIERRHQIGSHGTRREQILTFKVTSTKYSCLFNKLIDSVNFKLITVLVVKSVDLY